ncbi:heparinase II/III family protein [Zhouia spongiae]|uniref:Heparinase II/III family protein n=1 Tax=Zhouia spongiae TaxID=2202721 RepID=A0ABY3YI31_9FLAO|nr:alginate lyase family protein [Zhouia spongiae]UNY97489.1 heparinase II/III family protein [Zhouia spongiae]
MKKYVVILLLALFLSLTSFAQKKENIFDKLDLNRPELISVKELYDQGDIDGAKKALLGYYRKKENLYLRISEKDVAYIKSAFKDEVETSVRVADEVRNKYFLFRYEWDMEKTTVPYEFKGEIDWQANPFGDPEWTFMLSRHRFWLDLGKSYMLTGKEKYAKEFIDQAKHWIDNNTITDKTKWTTWRRIEAGIRMENWIKSFEYMKNSKYVTPEFLEKFLLSIAAHADYLDSQFNGHSRTSNWGVIEFSGLFSAAVFLSEFKNGKKWQESAADKLHECIQNQILEDGTQWEQSPMYHNEVMHCFMNTVLLAKRANIKLTDRLINRTKQMAYANLDWQKPNYNEPLLGDSDDNDLRDMLTTAAVLYNDRTLKSRAYDELNYENYFLFGNETNTTYKALGEKLPEFLSAYQSNAGDLYSRSSWGEDAFYSSFHMRRIGGGHSHDNLLHFTLFAYGQDYLVDTGRYTYMYNKWRQYFKENTAHNTLGVDNLTNSIYNGSWSNKFEAKSEGPYAIMEDSFDYAEAINKAYLRLEDPVLMKRRMLYLKPDVWLLVDSFEAEKDHVYSQYFNFADKKVKIEEGSLITTHDENNLRIQPLKEVEAQLTDAWYSPDYNYKEEITRAELSKKASGFNSFITLLYFPEHNNVEYEKIPVFNRGGKELAENQAEAVRLKIDEREYILVVSHDISTSLVPHKLVDNVVVMGEVVLIERNNGIQKIKVLK